MHLGVYTLFFCGVSLGATKDVLPVLLWSPERPMSGLPEVDPLTPLQTTDFHNKYLSPLMKDAKESAVAFLQDKLAVDDFTKYADVYNSNSDGGAFKNLKYLMEDNFSFEMPEVVSPHLALAELKRSFAGDIYIIDTDKSVEDLDKSVEDLGLDGRKRFLLIVNLKPILNSVNEESVIRENDEVVGKVIGHLEKNKIKYSAMFTGNHSAEDEVDEPEVHSGRHLLAEAEAATGNGTFMNVTSTDGNIFVYLRQAKLVFRETKKAKVVKTFSLQLLPTDTTAKTSTKVNNTAKVILSFDKVTANASSQEAYNVKITSDLLKIGDRWIIQRMSLDMAPATENGTSLTNATLVAQGVDKVIPLPYSFHCTSLKMHVEGLRDANKSAFQRTTLTMEGYQVQAFLIQQDRFFNAQDCVGFFTPGIWMGLFPVAILLVILLFGVMMLLSLSVMDRFDDPKGKTITVSMSD